MASVRPIPKSYYYSGQGRLGIGDRDPITGQLYNLEFVGNVTSLTIDIATTKFEHKESMSGDRAIDLTIVQEKNATFKFNAESLILTLMAVGLFGSSSTEDAGVVTGETHKAYLGKAMPLLNVNVSAVILTAGATPLVEGEGNDYLLDEGFGTVYILDTASIADGDEVSANYAYGAYDLIEAFTQATPPEKFLRFEGLNTVNGDLRVIDIPRAAFDPLTGLEFINEELGAGEFNGNILPDLTVVNPLKSKYFKERRVIAGGALPLPTVSSRTVANADPDALILIMSQPLTSANPTAAGGFTIAVVSGGGAAVTVTGVVVSGGSVALALSRALTNADVVTLSYTPPGTNPLGNANGLVAAFTAAAITNNVT